VSDWCYSDDEDLESGPPPTYDESVKDRKAAFDDATWLGAASVDASAKHALVGPGG
jgi:hypothetical protein